MIPMYRGDRTKKPLSLINEKEVFAMAIYSKLIKLINVKPISEQFQSNVKITLVLY